MCLYKLGGSNSDTRWKRKMLKPMIYFLCNMIKEKTNKEVPGNLQVKNEPQTEIL